MTPEQRTIKALVEALEEAATHVLELGCTCTPEWRIRYGGHRRDCSGHAYAKPYFALARRVRRRTATQEKP